MLQMRPSNEHVGDGFNAKEKVKQQKTKKEDEQPKQLQMITQSYRTQADERARQKSWSFLRQQEHQEKSVKLDFYSTEESGEVIDRLFEDSDKKTSFDIKPVQYLDTLVPYKMDQNTPTIQSVEQVSMDALHNKSNIEQVQVALFGAKILTFNRIKELCTSIKSDEELIPIVESLAVLIDGVWVIKSELNGSVDAKVEKTEAQDSKLIYVRDYMLYLFWKNKQVNRIQFSRDAHITPDQAKQLLDEIAIVAKVPNAYEGEWVLKHPMDNSFVKRKPEVVKRQQEEWKVREVIAEKHFVNKFEAKHDQAQNFIAAAQGVRSGSTHSEIEMDLIKFINKLLSKFGVISMELIKQQFEVQDEDAQRVKFASSALLDKVVKSLTVKFIGDTFVNKKADTPQDDVFRGVIIDLFQQMSERNETPTKDQISQHVREHVKDQTMTNAIFLRIVQKLAKPHPRDGTWTPRDGKP
ncbi:hypothetical protein AKO1_014424, partial [Acrasis kona]